MQETFRLGDIDVAFKRKRIKHIYLRVHSPDGRVTLTAPRGMEFTEVRAFAESRSDWIRKQQERLRSLRVEAPQQFVNGEVHNLWGRQCPLVVVERDAKPSIELDGRQILLSVRPGASRAGRAAAMHEWHKSLLHVVLPEMIREWEPRLGVRVTGYHLRRMRTRWGSCNYRAKRIRLNTELATRPRELLEYVLVHELLHLIVPRHDRKFYALMDRHYPAWREARRELNARTPGSREPD